MAFALPAVLCAVVGAIHQPACAESAAVGPSGVATRADADWWSLQPLQAPSVPVSGVDIWTRNPIDQFVVARLEKAGLSPSPRADPRTLVRRLYHDFIGLPPAPEVIEDFARDPSQRQWEALIDNLLASPRYGERWGRHWLDVARFGESDGYEYNEPRKNAWPYRDWVIQALNNDLPYDQFARMQIAGDVLEPGTVEGVAATGFLVAGVHNTVLGTSPAMKAAGRHEELEEMAGTVAQAFLGLTVHCARCHDHKFDPISARDYYGFIAALDGVTHGEREVRADDRWAAEREELQRRRDDLEGRLAKSIFARGGLVSNTANVLTLREPLEANHSGKRYRISLKVAPTVWASRGQATTDRDGVVISILREDGALAASERFQPLPWALGENAATYLDKDFSYVGDGSGPVVVRISPFPLHSNRFGGAVDDLVIEELSGCGVVLDESFDNLQSQNPASSQADTGAKVFYGMTSKRWSFSGTNSIHAVEAGQGNLALQLFAGGIGELALRAETEEERAMMTAIDAIDRDLDGLPDGTGKVFSVVPRQPAPMYVLERGDVTRPQAEVAPAGLPAIQKVASTFELGSHATDAERRRRLAEWISHPRNGPFHRVGVNRVWHHHFGNGLVSTPSDLGFMGGTPSHPALLEWLAVWFRDAGYSLKRLHRLIATSATYQQSSLAGDNWTHRTAREVDGSNRLLWRQNPRRVEAEVLRDSLLAVAGALNSQQFGPGYEDVRRVKVGPANYYVAIDPVGPEFNRRTIYRWQARGQRSALLDAFDCPDPSTATPVRSVTTTPSQALSQWNDAFVLRMAKRLGERIEREVGLDHGRQVERAWWLVLGRSPDDQERAAALALVDQNSLALLARVLFNSNEWIWIE